MQRRTLLAAGLATTAAPALAQAPQSSAIKTDPENTLFLDLKDGRVVIMLLPEIAPLHVERVKMLARANFYDNTPFHRVMEGFMAQGGDPTGTGTGTGGSGKGNVKAEFSKTRKFLRGTVGAARSQSPDSADSQFFIMFAPAPFLDGQYTIWGQVVSGIEFVDRIKRGVGQSGQVPNPPDRIVRLRVEADVKS